MNSIINNINTTMYDFFSNIRNETTEQINKDSSIYAVRKNAYFEKSMEIRFNLYGISPFHLGSPDKNRIIEWIKTLLAMNYKIQGDYTHPNELFWTKLILKHKHGKL